MTREEYEQNIIEDGKEYIKEWLDYNSEADLDDIVDAMFVSRVTGNDDGSYYFNAYRAKQAVKDVVFDDWFKDMCQEFGIFESSNPLETLFDHPEALDVTVRCYLLNSSEVTEAFEDYYSELTDK